MGRRVHVETDDVLDLGGEGGIGGPFERVQAMGLEVMGVQDALDGALRNADCFRHRPPGPWVTAPGGSVQVKTIHATTVGATGDVPGLRVLS